MPVPVFVAATAAISLTVIISLTKLRGGAAGRGEEAATAEASTSGRLSGWTKWQLLVGACGLAVFPQVLMSSLLLPGQGVAGIVTLLLLLAYFGVQVMWGLCTVTVRGCCIITFSLSQPSVPVMSYDL